MNTEVYQTICSSCLPPILSQVITTNTRPVRDSMTHTMAKYTTLKPIMAILMTMVLLPFTSVTMATIWSEITSVFVVMATGLVMLLAV